MAPLTRRRAGDGNVPTDLNARYYGQRASAGLIIAEASQIMPEGQGYPNTPGIHSRDQIKGWRKVTDAIHRRDGLCFLQLWHVGRHSHPLLQPGMKLPVAPSAIPMQGMIRTPLGYRPHVTPRALELHEIPGIIAQYAQAARNALEAGFDGVEIHGANGYLLDQFLEDGSNKRTDAYGGSIQNRARLMLEVTEAVCEAVGKERVGLRLSPSGLKMDMSDTNPVETFSYVVKELNKFDLVYLHLLEPVMVPLGPQHTNYLPLVTPYFRGLWNGTLISNGGYDADGARKVLEHGHADIIAFGKAYISNPDLVERVAEGYDFAPWDKDTFYGGDERGYIDYPDRFGNQVD